jgi:hypothetical protein
MVFFKLGTSSSLGKKEGVFIPPSPEKSDRWLPESPAKAGVKSG